MGAKYIELRRKLSVNFSDEILYTKASWNHLDDKPISFTPTPHTHSEYLKPINLDTPITDLNDLSLREVFEHTSRTDWNDLHSLSNFDLIDTRKVRISGYANNVNNAFEIPNSENKIFLNYYSGVDGILPTGAFTSFRGYIDGSSWLVITNPIGKTEEQLVSKIQTLPILSSISFYLYGSSNNADSLPYVRDFIYLNLTKIFSSGNEPSIEIMNYYLNMYKFLKFHARTDITEKFDVDLHVLGNLGVGTTNPSEKLHINGAGKFNGDVSIIGDGTVPNSPGIPGFYLGKSLSDENRRLEIVTGASSAYIDFTDISNDYLGRIIYNVSNHNMDIKINKTSKLTITPLGLNVYGDVTLEKNGLTDVGSKSIVLKGNTLGVDFSKDLKMTNDGNLLFGPNEIFHQGNDGSGSGMDADKIDGKHILPITQTDYSALVSGGTLDPNTIYLIKAG